MTRAQHFCGVLAYNHVPVNQFQVEEDGCVPLALTNVKPSKSNSILSMNCVSQVSVTAIMSDFVESVCTPRSDRLSNKLRSLV